MSKRQKWFLGISILFNVFFAIIFFFNYIWGYTYKQGILKKDVKVGILGSKDSVYFTLPKGLTVSDVSERGIGAIGMFENNRFEIVITSDDSLVNYNVPKNQLLPFGNLYSADSFKYK